MKSQSIIGIVLGSALGVALCFGIALGLFHLVQPTMHARPQFIAQGAVANQAPAPLIWDDLFQQMPVEKACTQQEAVTLRGPQVAAKEYTVSGPFTHANLSVYLIHGADTMKVQRVLTLEQGLTRNLAVVHETGTGQLTIDNLGATPLFIQAGDIIKGGTQDRVLPYDMLVPPLAQRQPIQALCVEQGRSRPRGNEISTSFGSSTEQLPGQKLKVAASRQSQGDVWNGVALLQSNLSRNAGGSVKSAQSSTSLQLTLENQRVQQAIETYLDKLFQTPDGKNDAIGFAVAVNGRIQSADVYASSSLFQELWPKLLKSSAVAALAERTDGRTFESPSTKSLQSFLAATETGQCFQQQVSPATLVLRTEGQSLVFDTCDIGQGNLVLHRSVLAK
ncbi:MAG: hypothetical protein HY040_01395 [Planctomycetes bacterium]|nr:hypothetical protein [Planctomycetota bacterium]